MIIITQTVGTSLSDLIIDENKFQTETGATDTLIAIFEYDGADWQYNGNIINLDNYGISFTGTPVATDAITVAYEPQNLWVFSAGKGINQFKLNYNFANLQQAVNNNETAINTINNTALLKDGSNLTQTIIDEFHQQTPNIITNSGTIALTDNSSNYLTLTGNGTISLPAISSDPYSHTIILVVAGGSYSLGLGTTKSLGNSFSIDSTKAYQVIYIYNKLDNSWYYCLGQ